ncbi:hypothetical protein VNO80_25174 [Phaseolus coccineus]|uniref:Uncharacterized protein n=1 Tax=Phaseolus coccineus TaxID=3886 RepID=A0AAN9QLQ1_PHACN
MQHHQHTHHPHYLSLLILKPSCSFSPFLFSISLHLPSSSSLIHNLNSLSLCILTKSLGVSQNSREFSFFFILHTLGGVMQTRERACKRAFVLVNSLPFRFMVSLSIQIASSMFWL